MELQKMISDSESDNLFFAKKRKNQNAVTYVDSDDRLIFGFKER